MSTFLGKGNPLTHVLVPHVLCPAGGPEKIEPLLVMELKAIPVMAAPPFGRVKPAL
jgi:hypothetical protein